MKRTINILGWATIAGLVLCALLLIAVTSSSGAFDPATIRIGGEALDLSGMDAGDWLAAAGGIALALLIVAVVVPLAVLIPLAVAAVAVVGALLLAAGLLAMVFSPVIFAALVVWAIVRLVRRGAATHRVEPPRGGATISG